MMKCLEGLTDPRQERVNGEGYREYAVVRLDGENWENDNHIQSQIIANREDGFEGWDAWKQKNKEGFDCIVRIIRRENKITISTKNFGLSVTSVTILPEEMMNEDTPVFAALTGDQCALTNIRIE